MPGYEPDFCLDGSAVLRRCVDDEGFAPYRPAGEFDAGEAGALELAELNAREDSVARELSTGNVAAFFAEHPEFRDWSEERLQSRGVEPTIERQAAYSIVARRLSAALAAVHQSSLGPPTRAQRLYAARPELFESLTAKDRLLRLTGESFEGIDVSQDPDLFVYAGLLVGFHPWLRNSPELIEALRHAAGTPGLRVWVAADPNRLPARNVSRWREMREEQLWGVPLTLDNIDSLDPKDQARSFHAPVGRHPLLEHSDPILGTWVAARAEPPRRIFYVQEALPQDHEHYVHAGMLRIRALHSERDTSLRAFTHVDGKIESYPLADWPPSRAAPSARIGPPSARCKLWRVDASEGMSDEDWWQLAGAFYRRNELVAEHFDALGTQPVGA